MEEKIYEVLRKHKLPLKKREQLIPDLLALSNTVWKSEQLVCDVCDGSGLMDYVIQKCQCTKCKGTGSIN